MEKKIFGPEDLARPYSVFGKAARARLIEMDKKPNDLTRHMRANGFPDANRKSINELLSGARGKNDIPMVMAACAFLGFEFSE